MCTNIKKRLYIKIAYEIIRESKNKIKTELFYICYHCTYPAKFFSFSVECKYHKIENVFYAVILLTLALFGVLKPRLAGRATCAARQLRPDMAWRNTWRSIFAN